MIDFLVDLCPAGGRVLDLGVGTGRVALRLAERGLRVYGMDSDPEMLAVLARQRGGDAITAMVGDFTTDTVGHEVDLVVLAMNTLFAVPTQEGQIAALTRAREQLADTGHVVLETFDPNVLYKQSFPATAMRPLSATAVAFSTTYAHFPTQSAAAAFAVLDEDGVRTASESGRYVWPSELDLMARLAGLRRVERFGGWRREPVGDDAMVLVSVYVKDHR
ncbi:bifunctional 2-polyprenyl-6-hydroxyphenol methylase/3-demethylubiquinol 3-O-methyltransferase UbiG [Actinokineospora sp. UTMC 2448]|uniref:class I SAM-dependent methyltransferase n=1 Tax=Actinokineospora sp. UTMC 2448 TaxID=2268449 RepID=UPI00216470D5|nr:class I SAM-dependent methyltransferase [Actinokineospora sp. UTMC 2448]